MTSDLPVQPPHDALAEAALVGSVLIDAEENARLLEAVPARAFYVAQHGWAWEAMQQLVTEHKQIDALTLAQLMQARAAYGKGHANLFEEAGGDVWVAGLLQVPSALNAETYATLVRERAEDRNILRTCSALAKLAWANDMPREDLRAEAMRLTAEMLDVGLRGGPRTGSEILTEVWERYEAIADGTIDPKGTGTGLVDVDRLLWGLQKGDLMVVAGRPGMGKSVFLANVAEHVSHTLNKRTLAFSLEMGGDKWQKRNLSYWADIDSQKLQVGVLDQRELGDVATAMGEHGADPIWIDDTPEITVADVRARARRIHARQGLELIVVDYLQFMRSAGRRDRRDIEISEMAQGLKTLARELNVPVIVAAQVGKQVEDRGDKRPGISDMREGGNVEGHADVVVGLYRDGYYYPTKAAYEAAGTHAGRQWNPNTGEVIVLKNRNGPTGTVLVGWDGARSRFYNIVRPVKGDQGALTRAEREQE